MNEMFLGASSFNGDLSKWDVSNVTTMVSMFREATSFDGKISNWNVSSVTCMNQMFYRATAFTQRLCGESWLRSTATKTSMFEGLSGPIPTHCTQQHGSSTTLAPQTIAERELVAHMIVSTAVISSTIARTGVCPKCGIFIKSGRVSCCAPGGAWHGNCGGAENDNVDHRWIEGMKACKRRFELTHVCTVFSLKA